MPKKKEIRRSNYHLLREAGFDSVEADRFKDRSQKLVKFLCDIKSEGDKEVEARIYKALNRGE